MGEFKAPSLRGLLNREKESSSESLDDAEIIRRTQEALLNKKNQDVKGQEDGQGMNHDRHRQRNSGITEMREGDHESEVKEESRAAEEEAEDEEEDGDDWEQPFWEPKN